MRLPVRCGPQAAPGRGSVAVAQTAPRSNQTGISSQPSASAATNGTRVIPHHLYHDRVSAAQVRTPEGYRPVWNDNRLNPQRAEQTLTGVAQTRLIWTQTVPRRLIDTTTGQDVTARVALVYPYTDAGTQRRELGEVTLVRKEGQLLKRIVRNPGAVVRQPTVSTRSAPVTQTQQPRAKAKAPVQKTAQPPAADQKYVQVGAFADPAAARAAAQRLARTGTPTRMGRMTRGGQTMQLVLAGPYTSSDAARSGLAAARRAGFSDAFVR